MTLLFGAIQRFENTGWKSAEGNRMAEGEGREAKIENLGPASPRRTCNSDCSISVCTAQYRFPAFIFARGYLGRKDKRPSSTIF